MLSEDLSMNNNKNQPIRKPNVKSNSASKINAPGSRNRPPSGRNGCSACTRQKKK